MLDCIFVDMPLTKSMSRIGEQFIDCINHRSTLISDCINFGSTPFIESKNAMNNHSNELCVLSDKKVIANNTLNVWWFTLTNDT